jgi:hypothetical protein
MIPNTIIQTTNGGLAIMFISRRRFVSVEPLNRELDKYAKAQETPPVNPTALILTQSKGNGASNVAL